jgi:hypothetical protein
LSKYRTGTVGNNNFLIIITGSRLRLAMADATHVDARFQILSIYNGSGTEGSGAGTLLTK